MPPIIPTKRYSPSGAPFVDGQDSEFLYIDDITFPSVEFTRNDATPLNESQSTKETQRLQFWPVPPETLIVVNPEGENEDNDPPAWAPLGFKQSHVRIIGSVTVFPDGANPTVPVGGAPAVQVVVGMSYMKALVDLQTVLVNPIVSLGFLLKGTEVNIFNEIR